MVGAEPEDEGGAKQLAQALAAVRLAVIAEVQPLQHLLVRQLLLLLSIN